MFNSRPFYNEIGLNGFKYSPDLCCDLKRKILNGIFTTIDERQMTRYDTVRQIGLKRKNLDSLKEINLNPDIVCAKMIRIGLEL